MSNHYGLTTRDEVAIRLALRNDISRLVHEIKGIAALNAQFNNAYWVEELVKQGRLDDARMAMLNVCNVTVTP